MLKDKIQKALDEAFAFYKQHKTEIPEILKEAMSYDDLERRIRDIIDPPDNEGCRTWRFYVRGTYPGYCVVCDSNTDTLYKVEYTVDAEDNVTLGQWFEAEYVLQVKGQAVTPPYTEPEIEIVTESAQDLRFFALTPLHEATAGEDGTFRVTVLRTGWNITLDGRQGDKYYTRQAAASLVTLLENARAYADHPTKLEENQRPERSIRDLVGWYTDVRQEPDGRVTANIHLLESASWLKEILGLIAAGKAPKDFAGISLNGAGQTRLGTAEGRRGKIVESIVYMQSSDVVTQAAAGGEIERLAASAKPRNTNKEVNLMPLDLSKLTIEELRTQRPDLFAQVERTRETAAPAAGTKTVEELVAETVAKSIDKITAAASAPAREAAEKLTRETIRLQAGPRIRELLRESKLPELTQTKLARLLEARDYIKDGALDEAVLKEVADAAIAEEREYLSKLTEAGKISGMGGGGDEPKPAEREKVVQGKLDSMFGVEEKPAETK